ncbi:MAG TPA: hypothetical protein VMO26_09305 [Vicinamibacterales bacterium]|nr:hypothetical protein [Vicinamibacterales bacterium]
MNEYIEVKFQKNNAWLKLAREVPGHGVELDEPDPIPRSVYLGIRGANTITDYRMRRVRQVKGWAPGEFRLRVAVEGGVLVLRGADKDSLPEGRYELRARLEEAKTKPARQFVNLEHDGGAQARVDVTLDDRTVTSQDVTDARIARVIDASRLNGQPATEWLADDRWRPAKKACLLNLLASLRIRPTRGAPLIEQVHDVFWVSNDRAYARVHRDLFTRLEALAADDARPFYREGRPHAEIHLRLLDEIPDEEKPRFSADSLVSFRGEGRPSLQTVVARPPIGLAHTYAEFDLDLGNALQDLEGFVVHMIELADGKRTDHLDLRKKLAKTRARDFLYYDIA